MSGLANYASGALDIATELRVSIGMSDVTLLQKSLNGETTSYWIRWRNQHHDLVCAFVAATPVERKRRKKFEGSRLMLTMAGIQLCQEAALLISVITTPPLTAGSSYRVMAAVAGDSFNRLFDEEIAYWSFADLLLSPFKDETVNTANKA